MNYHHNRSSSLLPSSLIIPKNTLSPKSIDHSVQPKRMNSSTSSCIKMNSSIDFNQSLYVSESLKNKVFSPDESFFQQETDDYPRRTSPSIKERPLSSLSYSPQKTKRKKVLVLDLDETLVHSSLRHFPFRADIELSIPLDGMYHRVYALKRPYANEFLKRMNELFDIYVFTASIPEYANPVLDILDRHNIIKRRLYRCDCIERNGSFIKDLSVVPRSINDIILIDNNPLSYSVNQSNGIPIQTWHDNPGDEELLKLIPLMEFLATVDDVRWVIDRIVSRHQVDYSIVFDIINASNEYRSKKKTYRKCSNEGNINDEYISITKAPPFTHKTTTTPIEKPNVIKVKQKAFNQSSCCRECAKSSIQKTKASDYNSKDRKANSTCLYNSIEDVKFVSLNHFIFPKDALNALSSKKEESKTRISQNALDLLTYDKNNKDRSSLSIQNSHNNLLMKFYNTDHTANDFNRKRGLFKRENSFSNFNRMNPFTSTPQKSPDIKIKRQLLNTPQSLHIDSYFNRYGPYKNDTNKSSDYDNITCNSSSRSTFASIKKRLMMIKSKEEYKLAPINTFNRDYEDNNKSSLAIKKDVLFNSAILPMKADNSFLIGTGSKTRQILAYKAKKARTHKTKQSAKGSAYISQRKRAFGLLR